jgi:hypothetical protein
MLFDLGSTLTPEQLNEIRRVCSEMAVKLSEAVPEAIKVLEENMKSPKLRVAAQAARAVLRFHRKLEKLKKLQSKLQSKQGTALQGIEALTKRSLN